MNLLQPKRGAHRIQLIHESADPPELRVIRSIGTAAAELIVSKDRATVAELAERIQAVTRHARTPWSRSKGVLHLRASRRHTTLPPVTGTWAGATAPRAATVAAPRYSRRLRLGIRGCVYDAREPLHRSTE
jgi:hypothetical protein